jgi:hypothetical protein
MLNLIRPLAEPFLRRHLTEFKQTLHTPDESQQRLLKKIIKGFAQTEYGRSLKIAANDDYPAFCAKTPMQSFDELSPWLERQQETEKPVLVAEPVLFYEKTSGSSAAAKLIPYTRSLKASFNRMFLIWLADLLMSLPELETGKTFISISPAFTKPQLTARHKPVGLTDDSEYLNPWLRKFLKPFLVLPPQLNRLQDPANFKHALTLALVAEADLEIISVWNPTLFEILLDYIQTNCELLIHDLMRGHVNFENLEFNFKRLSRDRLRLLNETSIDWQRLWPRLKLISCWTSAQAGPAAARLAAKFPVVFLQGKGLLATEAPVTLPLVEAQGFVPVINEVFFEFLDDREKPRLLTELEVGREYEIVLTQQGGLYRYRIGDRVRVSHFYRATPCLEFLGRTAEVCDLVGEKLNERFVQSCLARLSQPSGFQFLLPVNHKDPHYLLIVDQPIPDATSLEFERYLCEAYHYDKARKLGQLGPVQILSTLAARAIYFDYFLSKGMKLGDIKHRFLITNLQDAEGLLLKVRAAL